MGRPKTTTTTMTTTTVTTMVPMETTMERSP